MSAVESLVASEVPTPETLLERAAALTPSLAERRDDADRRRDVPPESIADIADMGLFRMYQPRRWGGYEADPRTLLAVQRTLAEGCPSTAWVYGVLSVQSLLVGRLDDRVQAEVWGEDDTTRICSSFAPAGRAEPVEGGYRLSGRWSYSSGSSYAQWAMVGGKVAGASAEGQPAFNLFLIPRRDYEIDDVWNTFGLRGTGSNDLVGKDIFVPEHRFIRMDAGMQNLTRATGRESALYRMPWSYVFACTVSNFGVGAARGGLRQFVEASAKKVSAVTGKAAKDDPVVAQAIGRMMMGIESAEALYDRHIARQRAYVDRDEVMPLAEAMLQRTQMSAELRRIYALYDDLMLLQGSHSIHTVSRVTRTWLDLAAARAHLGNDPAIGSAALGAARLDEAAG